MPSDHWIHFNQTNVWFSCLFIIIISIIAKQLRVAQLHHKYIRHQFQVNRRLATHWQRLQLRLYRSVRCSHKLIAHRTIHFNRRSHHFCISLSNSQTIKAYVSILCRMVKWTFLHRIRIRIRIWFASNVKLFFFSLFLDSYSNNNSKHLNQLSDHTRVDSPYRKWPNDLQRNWRITV